MYVDTTFLRTPEQRSVEKPGLKPNWRSEVAKCLLYCIKIHLSNTLLRLGAKAIGLYLSERVGYTLLVSRAIRKIRMVTFARFLCRVPECWNYQSDPSSHMTTHKNLI